MTTITLPISQVRAALPTLETTLEVLSDPQTRRAINQAKTEIKNSQLVNWSDIKDELAIDVPG